MTDEIRPLHMIVEQTARYPMRMIYDPETTSFTESEYSAAFELALVIAIFRSRK